MFHRQCRAEMTAKSKSILIWGSLLLVCVLSRLMSAIFYIEDIDSLRFAQSAVEYDVLNNKPHFPGYPLYCALLQLVYRAIGSTAYSFSLIGGIATFLIVVSTLRIQRLMMPKGPAVYLLGIILFFNPLMWLMGNRYMPDLLGLGMLQVALWLLLEYRIGERKKQEQSVLVFLGLSIGFLAGIRLSFLPFFLPAFFFLRRKEHLLFLICGGLVGGLLWFLPWVSVVGWPALLELATHDARGHFTEWGGTVISENAGMTLRFIRMVRALFADGYGGWWMDRNPTTMVTFASILVLGIGAFIRFRKGGWPRGTVVLMACCLAYSVWVFFFQNIVYKPRHILPLIPAMALFLASGAGALKQRVGRIGAVLMLCVFLVPYVLTSMVLVTQHQSPSALAQVRRHVHQQEGEVWLLSSNQLLRFYLKQTLPNHGLHFAKSESQFKNKCNSDECVILLTQGPLKSNPLTPLDEVRFYHNPFVNQLWPHFQINTYEVCPESPYLEPV